MQLQPKGASSPEMRKIFAAIEHHVKNGTPAPIQTVTDGKQIVVTPDGTPAFEVSRIPESMVSFRQLQEGPFPEETIRSLRSALGMAVRPAVTFNSWDGRLNTAILQVLPSDPENGMRMGKLMENLGLPRQQLKGCLENLLRQGKIEVKTLPERGRPRIFWKAMDKHSGK